MSENGGPEIKKTGPPPQGNRQPGGNGQNNGTPTGQSGPSIDKLMMIFLLGLVMTMLFNSCMNNFVKDTATKQISYSEFMQMAKEGKVKAIDIDEAESQIFIYPSDKDTDRGLIQAYYTGIVSTDTGLAEKMEEYGVDVNSEIPTQTSSIMSTLLSWVIPLLLAFWFLSALSRKAAKSMGSMSGMGGFGGMGKSRAKEYVAEGPKVTFKDVAGQDEAKESLMEIVDYLNNPEKYREIGAKLPKGALLVGPPGTGKTLLAKAVAGEAGVPFFSLAGSDFVEMFVGMGASRVRDLFKQAEAKAPCIIFIDEIDAIGKSRDNQLGSNDEREQTLNQLLVEMDGFGVNEGIIVMAATNRVDILDPAILRPGRFDRKVAVGRPDVKGREEILKVHVKGKPLAEDVDLHQIARTTPGFSGADLENLMNEAAIHAARNNARFIRMEDIRKSFIKVGIGTEKKSRLVPELERKITAYHEAGHAILFHLLPDVGPVYTVSIIPTGMGAAGYTMPVPENDNVFETKGRMIQEIKVGMGGRIAEELIFDDVTTGASQDIKQVTDTARSMITKFGMSDRLGFINYEENTDEVFLGRDLGHSRSFSEEVASIIDKEVKKLVDDCYTDAKRILTENMDVLHSCANLLLEKERISREEFEALFKNDKAAEENL